MGLKSKPKMNIFHVGVELIESLPVDDAVHRFAAFALSRALTGGQRLVLDTVAKRGVVRAMPTSHDFTNALTYLTKMGYISALGNDRYQLTHVGSAIHSALKISVEGHAIWYQEERT